MRYLCSLAIDVLGTGYVFFPGEVSVFILSVVITLALIWYVEKS